MVYGELGRQPITLHIRERGVNYWARLLSNQQKLAWHTYQIALTMPHRLPWLGHIASMLNDSGMTYIWASQSVPSGPWLKLTYHSIQVDQFLQTWYTGVQSSPKCITYRIFKEELRFENYLTALPYKYSKQIAKFRTSNHRLPIERQRYENIAREERKCDLCTLGFIGDEYHYILECPYFKSLRHKLLPSYCWQRPNILKLRWLFTCDAEKLQKLAIYVSSVMDTFVETT